jgi:mannose-6-phosphate isomerase-like protein (cupin superfamily)
VLEPGSVLQSPRGTRIEILQNDPERFELRREMPPLTGGGKAHRHLTVNERFDVLEGEVTGSVDDAARTLGAGDALVLPLGSTHVHPATAAGQTATITHTIEPRPRFVEVYSQSWLGWLQQGKTDDHDEPTLLQLMAILKEAGGGTWASGPPVALQKVVTPLLGLIANLLGVRAVRVPR